MPDLRPDARALLRAGKDAFRPQVGDRERVLQSLTRALGEGATSGALRRTDPPAGAASSFPLGSWALGGLGALAVGAGLMAASHSWKRASPAVTAPVSSAVSAAGPLPSATVPSVNADDLPETRAERRSTPVRPAAPSSAPHSAPDSLPEEVRLLSKAELQLGAGRPAEALSTLAEHERRYPSGVLVEERLAARVQALCALGRVSDARADLARLARGYPGSAHLDRARRFCGIDEP